MMNKSGANYSSRLYAIMNIKTGKLETKITNPGHKFWEIKGHCKNALDNYTEKYYNNLSKMNVLKMPHPNELKMVTFSLTLEG